MWTGFIWHESRGKVVGSCEYVNELSDSGPYKRLEISWLLASQGFYSTELAHYCSAAVDFRTFTSSSRRVSLLIYIHTYMAIDDTLIIINEWWDSNLYISSSSTMPIHRSSSPIPSKASFSTNGCGVCLLEGFKLTPESFSDSLLIDDVEDSVLLGDLTSPFYWYIIKKIIIVL